jgi:hypothetical protein
MHESEILALISEYLATHSYTSTLLTLASEHSALSTGARSLRNQAARVKAALLAGDWVEVERLCGKPVFRTQPAFLFRVFQQQFLELLEAGETQKALALLNRRIKPLEPSIDHAHFEHLCYLLTTKGHTAPARESIVDDMDSLLSEHAVEPGDLEPDRVPQDRLEILLEQALRFQGCPSDRIPRASLMLDYEPMVLPRVHDALLSRHVSARPVKALCWVPQTNMMWSSADLPESWSRCWDLDVALAALGEYVLASAHADGSVRVCVGRVPETLFADRSAKSQKRDESSGDHRSRQGEEDDNEDDNETEEEEEVRKRRQFMYLQHPSFAHTFLQPLHAETTHSSSSSTTTTTTTTIPSTSSSSSASTSIASSAATNANSTNASSDASSSSSISSSSTLTTSKSSSDRVRTVAVHARDIYCGRFSRSNASHFFTGGFDRHVRILDIRTLQVLDHNWSHPGGAVTCLAPHMPSGKLLCSGGRDCAIRFWDTASAACVRTIETHLGELTSLEFSRDGKYLLSASKDNSVRLWDVRTHRMVQRFRGHQNTSKNHIRARFACGDAVVVSGSEDGQVHVWDVTTGDALGALPCYGGAVFDVQYCGMDGGLLAAGCENGKCVVFRT